jgi:hypothetical protein
LFTSDPPNADALLLLICMKLVIPRKEAEIPADPLYYKAKSCFQLVESHGFISLQTLQAALLLSFYEIANAIYPAAFLTVGHCARLGHAIGIHDRKSAPQMFPLSSKWYIRALKARR